MADIRVNDIFEELIEDNIKITECLNVLIRFKTFVDLVVDKLKTNMESNVLQMFEDLDTEVDDVFKRHKRDFFVDKNLPKTKTQFFAFLTSNSQTNNGNNLQLSLQSNKDLKIRLLSKKKKTSKNKSPNHKTSEDKALMDENESFVCDFIGCGKDMKSRSSLTSHKRIHSSDPKPHQCHFEGCGFSTRKRIELTDHINSHKGIKPFTCEECNRNFTSEKLLKHHNRLRHDISDQILICEINECYKQFKTELSFRNHQKFHLMERRFSCEEPNCGFKTVSAALLKQHVFKVHSHYRPFKCPFKGCPKTFKSKYDHNYHLQSHSVERNYKCLSDGCDKAFKTPQDLRRHSILHTGVEYRCDWPGCDYISKNVFTLRSHQVIHSCERNFNCNWPECGKSFKTKPQLETHLRIHKSDKKFSCSWPGCQYRCTDSGNLFKHRRVHKRD